MSEKTEGVIKNVNSEILIYNFHISFQIMLIDLYAKRELTIRAFGHVQLCAKISNILICNELN
jgi:hypothetical protein